MENPRNSEWLIKARAEGMRPKEHVTVMIDNPIDEYTLLSHRSPEKIDWRCLVDLTVFVTVHDLAAEFDAMMQLIDCILPVGVNALYIECLKTGAVICFEYHGIILGVPCNFALPDENQSETFDRIINALAAPSPERNPLCN